MNTSFYPSFKPHPDSWESMASIERQLRERGEILRARNDDALIADVIGEVERLDSENAEITGQILRIMVGWEK